MTGSGFSDEGQRGASKGLEQLYRLADAWRECETLLKQAERIGGNAIIPTINQLRYAGTHHIDWIENRDAAALGKAIAHCHRGSYDALEVTLLANHERGRHVIDRLDAALVDTSDISVPGFDQYALREALADIEELSQDRKNSVAAREDDTVALPDLDRDYFQRAKAKRDTLVTAMLRTPDVLRELNKREERLQRAEEEKQRAEEEKELAVQEQRLEKRSSDRHRNIQTACTILALIVAALALFLD